MAKTAGGYDSMELGRGDDAFRRLCADNSPPGSTLGKSWQKEGGSDEKASLLL